MLCDTFSLFRYTFQKTAESYFGRLLACGAVISANMLDKGTKEEQHKFLECLIKAGKQRSYLSYGSVGFIVEYLQKIDEEAFTNIWDILEKETLRPWNEQTTDTLYLLFIAQEKFPNIVNAGVKRTFSSKHIVTEDNIPHLFQVLTVRFSTCNYNLSSNLLAVLHH